MWGLIFSIILFSLPAFSQTPDCANCARISQDMADLNKKASDNNALLEANKAALPKFGPSDVSQRIKIASNISILVVRVETFQNNLTTKKQEFEKAGCGACSK